MAGRPKQEKADIKAIQKLFSSTNYPDIVQDNVIKPVIAYTMRKSGCTFQEIADVFGFTRQMAETLYKKAEKEL